jgi:hypothetical protein
MKTLYMLAFGALLLGGATAVRADESGRVRAFYYEAAPGVLVDASMARPGAARWADVELESSVSDRRRVLVRVPPQLDANVGDYVGVQLASRHAENIPLQRISRITEVRSAALATR